MLFGFIVLFGVRNKIIIMRQFSHKDKHLVASICNDLAHQSYIMFMEIFCNLSEHKKGIANIKTHLGLARTLRIRQMLKHLDLDCS